MKDTPNWVCKVCGADLYCTVGQRYRFAKFHCTKDESHRGKIKKEDWEARMNRSPKTQEDPLGAIQAKLLEEITYAIDMAKTTHERNQRMIPHIIAATIAAHQLGVQDTNPG